MESANNQTIEMILDICVDRILKGQATIDMILADYPTQANELRAHLEAAIWLREQIPNTDPNPEFVSASSKRLIQQIQRENQVQQQSRQWIPSFWQNLFTSKKFAFQFGLVVIIIFSTLLFGGTVALAAQNTIPGQILYPVKTSLENVQLAIAASPAQEAKLHLQYADRRLTEIQTLSALENYDEFDNTVYNMDNHVSQALKVLQDQSIKDSVQTKDLAEEMRRALTRQEQALAYIKTKVPSKNQAALQQAAEISIQAMGIAQNVIETGNPLVTTSVTSTDSPPDTATVTPSPSETQGVTNTILAPPSSAFMASETLEPTTAQKATKTVKPTKTPKPANPNKPTAKPTKPPKATKTPKAEKTHKPKD